jgi:phosphonate metabolism protein PhnN/1,5-bisphosphokinase (PRPP-forming)
MNDATNALPRAGRIEGSERLIVVVGPSGAGKDSVLRAWLLGLDATERPHRARRTITRPADDASEDHEPVTEAAFDALLRDGAFAFTWAAHGLRYGVRHSELQALRRGGWVVMNGSRRHLPQLLSGAPGCRVVEITAPEAVRAQRIAQRGREHGAQLRERLEREAPATAIEPALRIVNAGDLREAAAALQAWWRAQQR